MTGYNPNTTNFGTEINVINPKDYTQTPYFTANATGAYINGAPIEPSSSVVSITAHSGGGQGSATLLTASYNLVTVVAANYDSVLLPPIPYPGDMVTIKNIGASILSVFPQTSNTINGLAVNLSIDIPVGGEITFSASSLTAWRTPIVIFSPSPTTQTGDLVIKASASAGNTQTTITNASMAAARTFTIPDSGVATDNFVMGAGIGSVQASRCTTQTSVTSSTVLVAVTGLTANVVAAGQYAFEAHLATTAGASGGTQAALGGTSTWTSINTTAQNLISGSAPVITTGTTATPATAIAGSTAANTEVVLRGTVVVNAAGTLTVMFAQNASNATPSIALVNSYFIVTRIA